jgi:hypothetical protein
METMMSTEELMHIKENLEKKLALIASRVDGSEALIASCRALAQHNVHRRTAAIESEFSTIKEDHIKSHLIGFLKFAIEHHPDPDGLEAGLCSMRKTLDDAKTEWKQSSVVKEENGRLEFEELEGEVDEVSARREKSLRARLHLVEMEISFHSFLDSKRCFIDNMTNVVYPLIIESYNTVLTLNPPTIVYPTLTPTTLNDQKILLCQNVDLLNEQLMDSLIKLNNCDLCWNSFYTNDSLRALLL